MKRPNSNRNRWADHYTLQAKKDHFPARSVYKLQEIQKKYKIIRPGQRVLDLGCCPGSWLLVAAGLTGDGGRVTGIDLKPVDQAVPRNVRVYTGDILALDPGFWAQAGEVYDVVLSDMAPDTTGDKRVNAARSSALSQAALTIAHNFLVTGGAFVCKIFQGAEFEAFTKTVRERFQTCKTFKPQSSRKASREIYVIGLGKHE